MIKTKATVSHGEIIIAAGKIQITVMTNAKGKEMDVYAENPRTPEKARYLCEVRAPEFRIYGCPAEFKGRCLLYEDRQDLYIVKKMRA